ncbi:hypothetical protein Busp01_15730 [Trinickia caryophylli]|uniref:Major Facilitator Superfamily protein n=2 Tax=Trinickia caryophylli TaxID=28094 RepID=A0A1X7DMH1_TRICW|nr:MFS transporter [Trinickia caryophylli]GLU31731.1 hypothetical protein Busp01_15730 [Trinickia caryophylli]SMF17611.1 Major Facilitator Superfamily protein [Trinickia caryophylli]
MARQHPAASAHRELSSGLILAMATASALLTANMYYAQPLVGLIGSSFGLSPAGAGLVVTLTQLGYGLGLLLIVPVADILENRRLMLRLIGFCVTSLFAASMARHAGVFLAASLCIGVSSVAVQILFPYASHLASDANRGRIIGVMTSGQMLGIMLARPAASVAAHAASWRLIFVLSGICLLASMVVVWRVLPPRMPQAGVGYRALLRLHGGPRTHDRVSPCR